MSNHSLTPKQQRFVQEYLIDLNATQAAIRAGYSVKSAEHIGYQLLQKTPVAHAIAAGQAKRAEKLDITLDRLTEMTLTAYRLATEPGGGERQDPKAAVAAVAQLSRMHGFDVGKRLNDRSPIEGLTAEQRDKIRRMVVEALERAQADEAVG